MPPQHPPPTLGAWLDPAMGKGPKQQAGNKKAGGSTGLDQQPDPLAALASALDRVRVSYPEDEVKDLLATSSALIEKEKRKKEERKPEWCRLRDLQTKLAKKKKAEENSKALAKEYQEKSESALQESQLHISKAAEAAKSVKELEQEIESLGTGGEDQEASKVHPWLPNRLRKALPRVQDSEAFKEQLEALAKAQQAMEKIVKEATPDPVPQEATARPEAGEGEKVADASMDIDQGESSEKEKEELIDRLASAFGLDEEARKRATEVMEQDGFQVVKKQRKG